MGLPDCRQFEDADSAGGVFDGADQSVDHLDLRDQPQPPRRLACCRHSFRKPVERHQQVGPAAARAEHIPRPQDCGVEAGRADHLLTIGAHLDVKLHHRRGLGHTHVHEMLYACLDRCLHRGLRRTLCLSMFTGQVSGWIEFQTCEKDCATEKAKACGRASPHASLGHSRPLAGPAGNSLSWPRRPGAADPAF